MNLTSALKLMARTWALLSLLVVALFSFGIGHQAWPTWKGVVSLLLFPGTLVGGLLLGWRRETLGGALCLSSYALYGLWRIHLGHGWPSGWVLPALAAPGLLYLLLASRKRDGRRRRTP